MRSSGGERRGLSHPRVSPSSLARHATQAASEVTRLALSGSAKEEALEEVQKTAAIFAPMLPM